MHAKAHLQKLLYQQNFIVCVGSGGVGKTTISAALGLYAASLGRKTCVITIDPAKRLANALGLKEFSGEIQHLSLELRQQLGIVREDAFSAMMLDLPTAWADFIGRMSRSALEKENILNNRLYKIVANDLPGSQEFIACEALYTLAKEMDFDLVILDTPPSANALDFFDAPKRILSMFDSDVFHFFSRDLNQTTKKSFFDFALTKGAKNILFNTLNKITGSHLLEEIGDFLNLLKDLTGPISNRSRGLQQLLRSPKSSFLVISSYDQNTLSEARQFIDLLEQRQFKVENIILNRLLSPSPLKGDLQGITKALKAQQISTENIDKILEAHNFRQQKYQNQQQLKSSFLTTIEQKETHKKQYLHEVAMIENIEHDPLQQLMQIAHALLEIDSVITEKSQ